MAIQMRACLYDSTGRTNPPFRAPFEDLSRLQLVGDCDSWNELQNLLHATQVDVVIVNLDEEEGRASTNTVRQINEVAPDCGIIGVSQTTDPDTIIAVMRAGCNQFVRWPIDSEDLDAALERVRKTLMPLSSGCRRICVVSAGGGAGATTVACNLAMELAQVTQRRCGLVDMDLHYGDVGCSFDVKPRYSIADVCCEESDLDRVLLETALEELACNVSIFARPEDVQAADNVTPNGIDAAFRIMTQMFPFIVVDVPRYLTPAALAALQGADHVLVVAQLTVPHMRNATRIYQHLLKLGAIEERIDLVLNRCNANFERIKPDEVERHFGRKIFGIIPNDYKRLGASRDLGHPIMSDAPNSPARLAIAEIAQRLAADHLGADTLRQQAGGVFGMFRRLRGKAKV